MGQWLFTIAAGPSQQQLELRAGCRSKGAWIDRLALGDAPVPFFLMEVEQGLPVPFLAQPPEVVSRASFDLSLAVSKQQLMTLQPQPTGCPQRRPIGTSHQLDPVA
jgi:hypothetical protein